MGENTPPAAAKRNWFGRHKILTAVGAIAIVVGIVSAAGGSHSEKKPGTPTATTSQAPAKDSGAKSTPNTTAYGSATLPLQNGDWRLDSIQVKNDGLGDFGATARITYTGGDSNGGDNVFTITVFKGKGVVGSLQGSANSVRPGTTVTVHLISQDKYVPGPYKYDFQNDL